MLQFSRRSITRAARRTTARRVSSVHVTSGNITVDFSGSWTNFGTAMTLPASPDDYNYVVTLTVRLLSGLLTVTAPSALAIRGRWTDGNATANIDPQPTMPVMTNQHYSETFSFVITSPPAGVTTLVLQYNDTAMADFSTYKGSYTIVAIPKTLAVKI